MVARRRDSDSKRDWYKVSVDTLRGYVIAGVIAVLGVVGWFAFQHWERSAVREQAAQLIEEATLLSRQLKSEKGVSAFQDEFSSGSRSLEEAQRDFDAQAFLQALVRARRSREVFASLLQAVREPRGRGEAHFIAVQGAVEYRRGERGEWETARTRVTLRAGDYVKTTAGGSAEVIFGDGTLYRIGPDTLMVIGAGTGGRGGERSVQLVSGWVDLNTAHTASRVATPDAEARVQDASEAMVSYDEEDSEARFAAYQGAVDVTSPTGDVRRVEAQHVVTQRAGRLSAPDLLPPVPELLEPPEGSEFDLKSVRRLVLRWEAVPGAGRYALQISRNRLFVDNVIEVNDRRGPRATLGVEGEGAFLWRVAAIGSSGQQGRWSEPRRFRVASLPAGLGEVDKTPPELKLEDIQSYGNIFILSGRTEPGATVGVNGEPVTVEADGTFTKTVQLWPEGWAFIDVRSTDAWGNRSQRRYRVFVESI